MQNALAKAYAGKRVFVTGHTGFKGSWLCEWLLGLGAEVTGYSLPPITSPALFDQLDLRNRLTHLEADLRDPACLAHAVGMAKPDFVFHLAAQPLVRASYAAPVETFEVNVLGTIHLMEALRALQQPCAGVLVTTDKCYENRELAHRYREEDSLGGYDPYSASKAAAEIAIASWRRSFFSQHPVRIASVRAGNVIGGGDWALDRILPDCIRSLQKNEPIGVRNPLATRPWQHVLEPLSGYLWLAAQLVGCPQLAEAFNFGPDEDSNRTVGELVSELLKHRPGKWMDQSNPNAPHEARLLQVCSEKAHRLLGWSPVWGFAEAVRETVQWYQNAECDPGCVQAITRRQLDAYTAAARKAQIPWAL